MYFVNTFILIVILAIGVLFGVLKPSFSYRSVPVFTVAIIVGVVLGFFAMLAIALALQVCCTKSGSVETEPETQQPVANPVKSIGEWERCVHTNLYDAMLGTVYMRAGTGLNSRSRHVYVSIIFIAFRLCEAGTFFLLSRLEAGSRFQQPGSRLKRDDFCHMNAPSRLFGTNSIFHSDKPGSYFFSFFVLSLYWC